MGRTAARLRQILTDRVLRGSGRTSPGMRRAAFDNRDVDPRARGLIDNVARRAWTVTDEGVASACAAGLSEDEIFELVIAAALGQSTRQLEAARAALDAADPAGRDADEPAIPGGDGGAR